MDIFNSFKMGNPQQQQVNRELNLAEEQLKIQKQATMIEGSRDEMADIAMLEGRSDLLKWQQDLGDELFDLIMSLKGYAKIAGEWKKVMDKPLCNDKFIYEVVVPQCKPYLSRNMINSRFDEKRILMRLKNTINCVADSMSDYWDRYGIDFINFDLVLETMKTVIIPGPFRALKGWTKKIDNSMNKRIEAFTDDDTPGRKGGLISFGNHANK